MAFLDCLVLFFELGDAVVECVKVRVDGALVSLTFVFDPPI